MAKHILVTIDDDATDVVFHISALRGVVSAVVVPEASSRRGPLVEQREDTYPYQR